MTEEQNPNPEAVEPVEPAPAQTPSTEPESTRIPPTEPEAVDVAAPEPTPEPLPPLEPTPAARLFHPATPIRPEEEEITIDISEAAPVDEYSPEERAQWLSRYTDTMRVFRTGEIVRGRIVAITDSDVAVDIGFKSEGAIPKIEFLNLADLKIGDEVEVYIDSIEDAEGTLILSKDKAEFMRVWEKINNLYTTGEMVEARIARRIKGGMVVDVFGVEAFLPGSQIDVHPVRDFDALVGAMMDFRIIKVNNARKNVVLSHKVLVEESLREIREKVLSELEVGQIVEGQVKNITDFGVFVDLGGVDGLLHITDLSWGRVSHPSDVVNLDERIKVKVLHYDKDRQRISLGLKQLKEHHWEEIEAKYPVSARVKGRVVSIVKYGAFVELEPGVEGLVHISEMSWTQHVKHPSQIVTVSDEVEVVVLNIDRDSRKISLGMKQVEEDPWERLETTYSARTRHKGIVRDLVPFGAFVELEPGIDGLIHISDLSWTRKVRHPGEIVKKGQEVEVVVLSFDRNERRIALGLKQIEDDPWDRFEKEYPIRARSGGSVIRVLEKGVVVVLPLGVEGFIPNSQLGKALVGDGKKNIKESDILELEVIEFDKGNRRIVLSHLIPERARERAALRAYQEGVEEVKVTIGDIVAAETPGPAEPVTKKPRRQPRKSKMETPLVAEAVANGDEPPAAEGETIVEAATPASVATEETSAEVTPVQEGEPPAGGELLTAQATDAPPAVIETPEETVVPAVATIEEPAAEATPVAENESLSEVEKRAAATADEPSAVVAEAPIEPAATAMTTTAETSSEETSLLEGEPPAET